MPIPSRALRPLALLAGVVPLLLPAAAPAAGWEPAAFPKEGKRTAQGCALAYTDESFVCLFVRCDAPGRLGLYVSAPGPDVEGAIRIAVDGTAHPVTFLKTSGSPLPLSNRAETFPPPLLAAMKTGRQLKLLDAGLTKGYDVIPLKGAGPAIARVETACAP